MRSSEVPERVRYQFSFFLPALLAASLTAGCSSTSIETARANFYTGRIPQANENLKDIPAGDKDEILYLCERGMIRQNLRLYDESEKDWRHATEINEQLPKYSFSKQTASFLINDNVLTFRGMPFERTLIYTYLAKSYFARGNWDYAAICGRNIISHLDNLDGFPDIPYSRYLAGFSLEMINDRGNAAIQYKAVGKSLNNLKSNLTIDPDTGRIETTSSNITSQIDGGPAACYSAKSAEAASATKHEPRTGISPVSSVATACPAKRSGEEAERDGHLTTDIPQGTCELVCFIGIGRTSKWGLSGYEFDMAPYAEIYCEGKYLGRSYPFANTAELMSDSKKRLAVLQAAKTATRIVVKEVIAESVAHQNEALGMATWLILFSLEQPDTRCWETLPLWLEIARLPCPDTLKSYKVIFKNSNGAALKSKAIDQPIARRGKVFVSFCRDLEPQATFSE